MPVDEEIPEIEGFVDLAVIGLGGSATVYSATQATMHRKVAIKVVEATGAHARRFEREVLALGKMEGIPHVVQVHSVEFTADGRPALVMPLMSTSLGAILRSRTCTITEVLKWARQLAVAIDEGHRREIWHRDIKPENVLISGFDDAYLADFGIATLADMAAATMTSLSLSPPYAPPERYTGGAEVASAGDVYSLAATLYAALAGRPPFGTTAEGGMQGLVIRITTTPPPSIAGVERSVFAVLERGLAKSSHQRPATAGELVAALEAADARSSSARPTPPPKDWNSDSTTEAFGATQAHVASPPRSRAGKGVDLTVGLVLSPSEAGSGGVHSVRAMDQTSHAGNHPEVQVRVPPGVRHGQRLQVEGRGGIGLGDGEPGDLHVVVYIAGESPFARQVDNVLVTIPVSAAALERGTQLDVATIHGDRATLKIPPRTDSGTEFRIHNGGLTTKFGRGEMVVTVVRLDDRPRPPAPPAPPPPPHWTDRITAPRRPETAKRATTRKGPALALLLATLLATTSAVVMQDQQWGPFARAESSAQSSTTAVTSTMPPSSTPTTSIAPTTTTEGPMATLATVKDVLARNSYVCIPIDGFTDISLDHAVTLLEAYRARELAAGHDISIIDEELFVVRGLPVQFTMEGCTKGGFGTPIVPAPFVQVWSWVPAGVEMAPFPSMVVVEPNNAAEAELSRLSGPVVLVDRVLGRRP